MSINHFLNKIKGIIGIDSTTFLLLCIIVLVSLSSFGLGRLSVSDTEEDLGIKLENTNEGTVKGEIGKSIEQESHIKNLDNNIKEKMYVASKNGKLYYTVSCSGSKRISEKNRVWFASADDAEKSGYTLSSSCK